MTTPIDPGNTEALAKIAYDQLVHAWGLTWEQRESGSVEKYRRVASAVARAVCPPGHHVIADDDLRILLNFAVDAGERAGIAGYAPMLTDAYDRLRAAIGDEG